MKGKALVLGVLLLLGSALAKTDYQQVINTEDKHPWGTLLNDSYYFYEAQQSGLLPEWNRARRDQPAGWRDDAHTTDGSVVSLDLSGGFYDAGDFMKFALPYTSAFSAIAMGALTFKEGYVLSGTWDYMARNLKWAADYLIKSHNNETNAIVTQVGSTDADHVNWGRPEQYPATVPRPVFISDPASTTTKPSVDVMSGAAATMALSAIVLKADAPYSEELIKRAKQLLAGAETLMTTPNACPLPQSFNGPAATCLFADSTAGTQPYPSEHYVDELLLAHMAVCWHDVDALGPSVTPATVPTSCTTAFSRYNDIMGSSANAFSFLRQKFISQHVWDWNNAMFAAAAAAVTISTKYPAVTQVTGAITVPASSFIDDRLVNWMGPTIGDCDAVATADPGYFGTSTGKACMTPGGLAYWSNWAPLRHTMNVALGAMLQADSKAKLGKKPADAQALRCWARDQLLYVVGGKTNQSFVVGYGAKYPGHAHHRSSSCDRDYTLPCGKPQEISPAANPNVVLGALVGGPNSQDLYEDSRSAFEQSEVALDYNAGYTGVLAAVAKLTAHLHAAQCTWADYCSGKCSGDVEAAIPDAAMPDPQQPGGTGPGPTPGGPGVSPPVGPGTPTPVRSPNPPLYKRTPLPGLTESSDSGLSTGAIAGIVIAAIAVVALAIFGVAKWREGKSSSSTDAGWPGATGGWPGQGKAGDPFLQPHFSARNQGGLATVISGRHQGKKYTSLKGKKTPQLEQVLITPTKGPQPAPDV